MEELQWQVRNNVTRIICIILAVKLGYKNFEFIVVNVYILINASAYYNSDYWIHLEIILEEIVI